VGRAPAFWTEENTRLIRDHFVAVSLSNVDQNRKDAVGQFLRDAGMQLPGAGGSQWCVTAAGKVLESNNHNGLGFNLKRALEKWQALPEAERTPGAVKVPELGEVDGQRAAPKPPPGTLILKLYYRAFTRSPEGKFRYLTGKDLWHDEQGEKTEAKFDETYPGQITTPQAQPDHMWLAEAEWKALMPADPRPGDKVSLPAALADRLVRRHLNPLSVYGETEPLQRREVRSAELTLTIQEVSKAQVRLRLEGQAKLGKEPPAEAVAGRTACVKDWGYEPRLLGFLEYDPQKRVFTRFDVLALGDHFGRLGICDSGARPGLQPLGISFELVKGDRPADQVPPGRAPTARHYFDPAR
jgi:hypothetical protein